MRKERGLDRSIDKLLIISIILNILFFISLVPLIPKIKRDAPPPRGSYVTIGYDVELATIDPVDTWHTPSRVVQHQVTQSLVEYDLSTHPNYQLKPVLSEYWIWENKTRISFKLRDNIYFHDETRMTAEDVKWNFERVKFFCNATGSLQANTTSWEARPSSLFFLLNGTYIFKSFEANDTIDPLNFTINLNSPFSALLDLLSFGATNILSPESTPRYHYLNLETDSLIGTGPYRYIHFQRKRQVRLERNNMYWAFPGTFELVDFRFIEDDIARMNAGLAGQYDYVCGILKTYIDQFTKIVHMHVEEVGEDLNYSYIEFYCGPRDYNGDFIKNGTNKWQYQRNNATLRRALALAINYSYIYNKIHEGYAIESPSAIARVMPGYNASVVQASDYNFSVGVEKARNLMKLYNSTCTGWNSSFPGTDESLWTNNNLLGKNLQINRLLNNNINFELNKLLIENWALIGVQAYETIRDRDDFMEIEKNPWKTDIIYNEFCPDYLNPYNIINPLFNLQSEYCLSKINDSRVGGLTDMIYSAINEINRTKQSEIYGNIQSYIFDVNRPLIPASNVHISGWVYKIHQIHKEELKGVQYNVLGLLDIANWYELD
ncbi:MAG: ABC transporter substrate-binding protein [Candidatus Hermodarchaeota archaeon]